MHHPHQFRTKKSRPMRVTLRPTVAPMWAAIERVLSRPPSACQVQATVIVTKLAAGARISTRTGWTTDGDASRVSDRLLVIHVCWKLRTCRAPTGGFSGSLAGSQDSNHLLVCRPDSPKFCHAHFVTISSFWFLLQCGSNAFVFMFYGLECLFVFYTL